MSDFKPLRLKAETGDDLPVISAALQDGISQIGDFLYEARQKRFSFAINRYRWEASHPKRSAGERVKTAVQLASVLSVKAKNLKLGVPDAFVSLLSIRFEPGEEPGGQVLLTFSGGGEIRLDVDCVDLLMADVSDPWKASQRPEHPEDSDPS